MKKITRKAKIILFSMLSLAICLIVVGGILYSCKCTPSLIDGRMDSGQTIFLIFGGGFVGLVFIIFMGLLIWRFFRRNVVHPLKKHVFEMKTSAEEDDDNEGTE